jgi:hypothetical protein
MKHREGSNDRSISNLFHALTFVGIPTIGNWKNMYFLHEIIVYHGYMWLFPRVDPKSRIYNLQPSAEQKSIIKCGIYPSGMWMQFVAIQVRI